MRCSGLAGRSLECVARQVVWCRRDSRRSVTFGERTRSCDGLRWRERAEMMEWAGLSRVLRERRRQPFQRRRYILGNPSAHPYLTPPLPRGSRGNGYELNSRARTSPRHRVVGCHWHTSTALINCNSCSPRPECESECLPPRCARGLHRPCMISPRPQPIRLDWAVRIPGRG